MRDTSESQGSPLGGDHLLERAQQALDGQRWPEAITLARQAIEEALPPDRHPAAFLILARALWHEGDLVECCRSALRCEELSRQSLDDTCAVNAATLAAFALAELKLELHALPLAQRALATAQKPDVYRELPRALSCVAHVYARLSDLESSDELHMRALSLARETRDWRALQMAYDNLLVSFNILLRNLELTGDKVGVAAVVARSKRYIPHVRSLLGNEELEEWRRGSLTCNLAELLLLSGELGQAHLLLQENLDRSRQVPAGSLDALASQIVLAELLHRRGQPEAALAQLSEGLASSSLGYGGYRQQLRCLQIAESCYKGLGRALEADAVAQRIRNAMQGHEQMRDLAMQVLPPLLCAEAS